jgi:hypothetical protein
MDTLSVAVMRKKTQLSNEISRNNTNSYLRPAHVSMSSAPMYDMSGFVLFTSSYSIIVCANALSRAAVYTYMMRACICIVCYNIGLKSNER